MPLAMAPLVSGLNSSMVAGNTQNGCQSGAKIVPNRLRLPSIAVGSGARVSERRYAHETGRRMHRLDVSAQHEDAPPERRSQR